MMLAYALFAILVMGFVIALPVRIAVVLAYIGGWIFLPVADFPETTITETYFTVDVIGAVLPSNLGLTKAVAIPVIILAALAIKTGRMLVPDRLTIFDMALILFCLWPLAGVVLASHSPELAVLNTLYLAAAWGGSWLIGRQCFSGVEGEQVLLKAIALSGLALLPFSLLEGVHPAFVYHFVYGPHPFLTEGAVRYFGYRPLGFFEHGNQFAIWMAMAVLGWFALLRAGEWRGLPAVGGCFLLALATFASQSLGAIFLMLAGLVWMAVPPPMARRALLVVSLGAGLLGIVYFSGILPTSRDSWHAIVGDRAMELLIATKRASIGYRILRDQMALPLLLQSPLAGYGIWDWWRSLGSHPWGLPLLIGGQFGIVALVLNALFMLGGSLRRIMGGAGAGGLAVIVLLAGVDAWLNSYIFAPAILAAAAISVKKEGAVQKNRTKREIREMPAEKGNIA